MGRFGFGVECQRTERERSKGWLASRVFALLLARNERQTSVELEVRVLRFTTRVSLF